MAKPFGKSMFNFKRNCLTFPSDYTILFILPPEMLIPFTLHLYLNSVWLVFLLLAILVVVLWYLFDFNLHYLDN